jgi:hypothetical protein
MMLSRAARSVAASARHERGCCRALVRRQLATFGAAPLVARAVGQPLVIRATHHSSADIEWYLPIPHHREESGTVAAIAYLPSDVDGYTEEQVPGGLFTPIDPIYAVDDLSVLDAFIHEDEDVDIGVCICGAYGIAGGTHYAKPSPDEPLEECGTFL